MWFIFLDIDGVLATDKEFMRNRKRFHEKNPEMKKLHVPYPFHKKCVKVLNEIIEKTNAEIILSSDWRLHWNLEELDLIFKFNKVIKSPKSMTPVAYTSMSNLSRNRASEIAAYIQTNSIKNYIVIDDLNIGKYMSYTNDEFRFFATEDSMGISKSGLKDKILKLMLSESID